MNRSIRIRLLVSLLALLIPLSAGAAWLLIQVFGNRLLHDIDVTLGEEAETVAELLATPVSRNTVEELINHIAGESEHGAQKYITITRDGQLVSEAPRGAERLLAAGDPRLRVVRYAAPHSALVVTIAVSASSALHAKQRLTSLLVIGTPLMLALVAGVLWLVMSRALRPLEQAAQQLAGIGADNLSVRVAVENRDDEVGRMITILNRMLDRLQRAVSELQRFTADAAHELRTPLTVLRAGLDVALARERSAPEYRAALRDAVDGIDRMRHVADDLLTLARLEASAAPHAAGPVDLGEMLHELADAWAELASQRGVAIDVAAARGLWTHGNGGDLYRLFNNLIENAVVHGSNAGVNGDPREAGARVRLSAGHASGNVEVQVADNGPGIPLDERERVFERFYRSQGNEGTTNGTGLGLSIAMQIVRTHQGRITVGSREGGGCVIAVTLPGVDRPGAAA